MIELFFAFLLGKTTFIPHHKMFSRHQSVCAAAVLETKPQLGTVHQLHLVTKARDSLSCEDYLTEDKELAKGSC